MSDERLPWWRRALRAALNGIRAMVGLKRPEQPDSDVEPEAPAGANTKTEEETELSPEIPNPNPNPRSIVIDSASERAPAVEPRAEALPASPAEPAAEVRPEPPLQAAGAGAERDGDASTTESGEAASTLEESAPMQARTDQPADETWGAEAPGDPPSENAAELSQPAAGVPLEPSAESAAESEAGSETTPQRRLPEDVEAVAEPVEPEAQAAEAAAHEPDAVDTMAGGEPVPELPAESAVTPLDEEPPAAGAEAETALPAEEQLSAPAPEPVADAAPAADWPQGGIAIEEAHAAAAASREEPAAETAPVEALPAVQAPLFPAAAGEEKPAVRTALKPDVPNDQSPFSVIVSQVYEGPLDLLLDLIRKQDIDIYDIPIARITAQFLAYVSQLRAGDVDVAGEFIYMASLLIHIKSKMLLPRAPAGPDEAAEDPRRELVERLLEHERFKNAAQMLQEKQMLEAATWSNPGIREFREDAAAEPEIAADTVDLVRVFRDILDRARNRPVINLQEDSVTVGQMIQFLGRRLTLEDKPVALRKLLSQTRSERALIAMFLALLELVRLQAILLRQDRHFSEIFIKKNSGFDSVMNQGAARDDWQ